MITHLKQAGSLQFALKEKAGGEAFFHAEFAREKGRAPCHGMALRGRYIPVDYIVSGTLRYFPSNFSTKFLQWERLVSCSPPPSSGSPSYVTITCRCHTHSEQLGFTHMVFCCHTGNWDTTVWFSSFSSVCLCVPTIGSRLTFAWQGSVIISPFHAYHEEE